MDLMFSKLLLSFEIPSHPPKYHIDKEPKPGAMDNYRKEI